jgi:hypothetical protein
MFLFIYNDYFELHQPGALQGILAGKMGPFAPVTQGVLVGTSALLIAPSLMIFLSLALRPSVNRWLNVILGVAYTLIEVATMIGSWAYYEIYCAIEIGLTLLIAYYAWTWPKAEST